MCAICLCALLRQSALLVPELTCKRKDRILVFIMLHEQLMQMPVA